MSPETKLYKSDYRIHKELLGKMEVVEENIKERIIRDLANRI